MREHGGIDAGDAYARRLAGGQCDAGRALCRDYEQRRVLRQGRRREARESDDQRASADAAHRDLQKLPFTKTRSIVIFCGPICRSATLTEPLLSRTTLASIAPAVARPVKSSPLLASTLVLASVSLPGSAAIHRGMECSVPTGFAPASSARIARAWPSQVPGSASPGIFMVTSFPCNSPWIAQWSSFHLRPMLVLTSPLSVTKCEALIIAASGLTHSICTESCV